MLNLGEVEAAAARLRPHLLPTPLEWVGDNLWLKLENANRTHSFKVRGALNALLALSEAERAAGVITASSGNHAQGIAYAAHLTGTSARVLSFVAYQVNLGELNWPFGGALAVALLFAFIHSDSS